MKIMFGCIVIKKRLQHWLFIVNIAKFLRTAFFHRSPPLAASDVNINHTFSEPRKPFQREIILRESGN